MFNVSYSKIIIYDILYFTIILFEYFYEKSVINIK